jgi:hypothetical protein
VVSAVAKCGKGSGRLWRGILGVLVSYAIAIQGLFIGLTGSAIPAKADQGSLFFQLCLNGSKNAPGSPEEIPRHIGHDQCVFCFAQPNPALCGAPPGGFFRIDVEGECIRHTVYAERVGPLPPYWIARPRGPPFEA